MHPLAFKMLFHKKGTASAIIAIALLVALVAAVNCLVNSINEQSTALGRLAGISGTYIVTSKNSTCLSDSQIDAAVIQQIKNNSNVQCVSCQRIVSATLISGSGNFSVTVLGVDNATVFFKMHPASLNGSICQQSAKADVGTILSKFYGINKNDQLNLTINGKTAQFTVAGIVQGIEQTDAEAIVTLNALDEIAPLDSVSFVEFSIKDPAQTIVDISNALPSDAKISSTQQVTAFAQDINNQTVTFISVWSVAVYTVVAAASYIIASRVVNEAEYEFGMLRAFGTKKNAAFNLVFVYALIVASVGSVLGVSVGIVGAQFGATFVRWVWGSTLLVPFLELNQAVLILLFALASSLVGCVYPTLRGSCDLSGANMP